MTEPDNGEEWLARLKGSCDYHEDREDEYEEISYKRRCTNHDDGEDGKEYERDNDDGDAAMRRGRNTRLTCSKNTERLCSLLD